MKKILHFKIKEFLPLTDTQWAKIQYIVEKPYLTGWWRTINLCSVVDGLGYLFRTGVQWRNVGKSFRWRSAAQLNFYRRLSKDYEK